MNQKTFREIYDGTYDYPLPEKVEEFLDFGYHVLCNKNINKIEINLREPEFKPTNNDLAQSIVLNPGECAIEIREAGSGYTKLIKYLILRNTDDIKKILCGLPPCRTSTPY